MQHFQAFALESWFPPLAVLCAHKKQSTQHFAFWAGGIQAQRSACFASPCLTVFTGYRRGRYLLVKLGKKVLTWLQLFHVAAQAC